jgi:hypothetical protein
MIVIFLLLVIVALLAINSFFAYVTAKSNNKDELVSAIDKLHGFLNKEKNKLNNKDN